jgi:ribosomal protein L7/L12
VESDQRASKLDITRTQAIKMLRSGKHPVIPGLAKPQAEALKVEFEALGATVRIASAGSDS